MYSVRKSILMLFIVAAMSPYGSSAVPDDAADMLARGEALYYEADFAKSIEVLLRADELLRQQPGRLKDKTDIKLQLALGFIGLNDTAKAKAYLGELYAIDADHRLDPQVLSPKVVRLAEDAKAEQNELRCRSLLDETQRQVSAGDGDAVVRLVGTPQVSCPGLTAIYPKAAALLFKEGLDAYKKGQMNQALQKFRSALRLDPEHELAAQYVDLTQSKLEVTADRTLLTWRKDFNAGDFEAAARDYRELTSVSSSEAVDEVRSEYRGALSNLVDSFNRACANDDAATMNEIRSRIDILRPEPSFGEDILAKMSSCTRNGCTTMNTQLALARLKTRVDPHFASFVVSQMKLSPVTVRVKARINETGDVVRTEMQGGNPLLYNGIREAFEQWKFSPAVIDGEQRCIDTEIPIVINFASR
jgi:tetratricopeptide (TPR) repeat protein